MILFLLNLTSKDIPEWVPERKKAIFLKYIQKAEFHREKSLEYSNFLKSKRIFIKCKINGKIVTYFTERGNIPEKFVTEYSINPKKCTIEDGEASLIFENEPSGIIEIIKEKATEWGIVGLIFFILGLAV